jgi:hypothetical protein
VPACSAPRTGSRAVSRTSLRVMRGVSRSVGGTARSFMRGRALQAAKDRAGEGQALPMLLVRRRKGFDEAFGEGEKLIGVGDLL